MSFLCLYVFGGSAPGIRRRRRSFSCHRKQQPRYQRIVTLGLQKNSFSVTPSRQGHSANSRDLDKPEIAVCGRPGTIGVPLRHPLVLHRGRVRSVRGALPCRFLSHRNFGILFSLAGRVGANIRIGFWLSVRRARRQVYDQLSRRCVRLLNQGRKEEESWPRR